MPGKFILAIDQGTTSSRAIIYDKDLRSVASAQLEFQQYFPSSGLVEHDPEEIWTSTLQVCREAIAKAQAGPNDLIALGIANQRETVVVWERTTHRPIYNAIVWQDRRTAQNCARLKSEGVELMVAEKTGLLLDPYFSASKLGWILDNVAGARAAAEAGNLLFGTIDTYLIWRLTGGDHHRTDATNAARTMMYNILDGSWDAELLKLFNIPGAMLPEVGDCAGDFGTTHPDLFGKPIPILGVAGDQQAATLGQACFSPGMIKSTYGTGCFALMNTGEILVRSKNRLLGTIAYQLDGKVTYALEGSIFVAGAVVQWLRDEMKIIGSADAAQSLAVEADPTQNVILVPAFTGLGAPYWNANCRGAIFGLTRNSGPAELARAALESVGFQTRDLLNAMKGDMDQLSSELQSVLRVDGGMSANDYAMQFLADITYAPVDRPKTRETTALGVAWLAGKQAGIYPDQAEFAASWSVERQFTPSMKHADAETKYATWRSAVTATLNFHA